MHRNQTCHFRNVSLPKRTNRVAGNSGDGQVENKFEFIHRKFESIVFLLELGLRKLLQYMASEAALLVLLQLATPTTVSY